MKRLQVLWFPCFALLVQGALVSIAEGQVAVPNPALPTSPSLPGLDDPSKGKPQAVAQETPAKLTTAAPKAPEYEIMRVLSPGVFDVKTGDFQVRFRAWGVGFPKRDQPGYREALRFTEEILLGVKVNLQVKREFDADNLKLVDLRPVGSSMTFSRQAILSGHGWHLDKETNRYGPFALAQMKAKRMNLGVWKNPFAYGSATGESAPPQPKLPGALFRQQQASESGTRITFWVSSVGKVHRPGCAFYRRGRGVLTPTPQGYDCGICGGKVGKRQR